MLQILKSPQKSLLGQVFCILNIAIGEVKSDGIGLLLIAVNQLFYCPLVL